MGKPVDIVRISYIAMPTYNIRICICAYISLRIIYVDMPPHKMHGQTDVYYTQFLHWHAYGGLRTYYRSAEMVGIAPLLAMVPDFIG